MREHTKSIFVIPYLIQEFAAGSLLLPVVLMFLYKFSPSVKAYIWDYSILISIQFNVGLIVAIGTKFFYSGPIIRYLEGEGDLEGAAHSASRMPFAEAVVQLSRWTLIPLVFIFLPMYMNGKLTWGEFVAGMCTLTLTGFSGMLFIYLFSESRLMDFYRISNCREMFDGKMDLPRISLSVKIALVILLTALPPVLDVITGIEYAVYSSMDLSSLKSAFFLVCIQCMFMVAINSSTLLKSLSISMGDMSKLLMKMAMGEGDLTLRLHVTGLNDLGAMAFWFNTFVVNLDGMINQSKKTAIELNRGIREVRNGSQDLAKLSFEQASSAEQISSSIEEMVAAFGNSISLMEEGRETSQVISKLMEKTRETFTGLMQSIQDMSKSSKKIGDIVGTVNEVAFQTNLLALNAAVEAARAGEHGKGFAVVAGEVRALAQRSASASKEIRMLIEGTVEGIRNSDELITRTSDSVEEMNSRLHTFFKTLEEVNRAGVEQSRGIDALHMAISRIDNGIQRSAATVEEFTSTMDGLHSEATVLAGNVKKFKTSGYRQ